MFRFVLLLLLIVLGGACQPQAPRNDTGLRLVTPAPPDATSALVDRQTEPPAPTSQWLSPTSCPAADAEAAHAEIAPHESTWDAPFVQAMGAQLVVDDAVYVIYGIRYQPRDHPHPASLLDVSQQTLAFEIDLIQAAGFNTLILEIEHQTLFQCFGNGAVPVPDRLATLDAIIRAAGSREMRVILVLNVAADLVDRPLYAAPEEIMAQMRYLAYRYAEDPTVMAYDLRPRPDQDLRDRYPLRRQDINAWFDQAVSLMRLAAPNQILMVSWQIDPTVIRPAVDLQTVYHQGDLNDLRQAIANGKAVSETPLLIQVQYDTVETDELGQRQAYFRAFEAAQQNELAGWIVGRAFDHPVSTVCRRALTECRDDPDVLMASRGGIWNTSYFPKRALDAVMLASGIITRDDLP